MSATIKDTGEVYVDDDLIGRLDGLKFTADTSQSGLEAQALATAAQKAVGPEVDRRLTSLSSGTHQIFTLSDTGHIMWGGMDVGRRLLSLLIAYGAGGNKKPWIPFAGVTSIPNEGDLASSGFTEQALSLAGYRAVGPRIIRFDILNRLSFLIREAQDQFKKTKTPEARGHKFQVMAEMLALLGSTYEDVQGVLTALGYKSEIAEKSLTVAPVADKPNVESASNPAEEDTASSAPATKETSQDENSTPEVLKPEASTPDPLNPEVSTTEARPEVTKTPNAPKPAPRKPQSKKSLSLYHHRVTNAAGETKEVENLEYWYFPSRGQKGFKPAGRGKPAYKGKRGKGPKPRRDAPKSAKPPTQKQVENSPFAALAALKNPKKD